MGRRLKDNYVRLTCLTLLAWLFSSSLCWSYIPNFSILDPQTSEKQRGIGGGKFRLLPEISTAFFYDSNAIFASSGQEADAYYEVRPELGLKYFGNKIEGGLKYSLSWIDYFKQNEQDGLSNFLDSDIQINQNGSLSLALKGNYSLSPDLADTEILRRVDRRRFGFGAHGGYKNPQDTLSLKTGYNYSQTNFASELDGLDLDEQEIDFAASIRFLPKTSATITFNYGQDDYPHSDVSGLTTFSGMLGLYGAITSRLNLTVKIGMSYLMPEILGNDTTFVTIAILNESFTPRTRFRVGYIRESTSSAFSSYSLQDHILLYFDQKIARLIEGQLRFDFYNLSYRNTAFDLSLPDRKDQVYQGTIRFLWKFRDHFRAFFEYIGEGRNSNTIVPSTNQPGSDFVRHRLGIGVSYLY